MHLTYQFSTIFSSSYSFINPKFPNFNHKSHKFKTFFSYKSPNSSHDANLHHPVEKLPSLCKTLKSKIDAEDNIFNISDPETAILALKYFLDEIRPENRLILYNIVFNWFRDIKDFENAEKLFDEMLQRGVKPNTLTFSNLIRCAALCSLLHKAAEFFERMPSFGCEPDYNVSSSMIYVYARKGNVDMALKLYDSAKKKKWIIRPVAFSALIKMYGFLGNYDGCLSVYNDMKVLGFRPNMTLYNSLLYAMGRAKRLKDANDVYVEMRKNGFEPNWPTYAVLLEAYSKGRLSKEALSLYNDMKEKGMFLNKFLYSSLIDMCADVGYIYEAVEIFEEMKRSRTCQPDSFIYTSLINMYACNGKVLEAESILNEMISSGFEPNICVLTIFVHCYGKAKRIDDIVKIFNQYWDVGITPDDRLWVSLLYVMTQIPKEELGKITNCIEKGNPKLGYIVTYLTEEKEDDGYFIKEVSELLSSTDEYVKKSVCNSLIDICYNLGMEDRARDLLGLGLWLEIYSDIQSRSETELCLNLKQFSVGAAITALHVWLDDLSKAFESGEELPEVLGICFRHKPSDKDLACLFESYLKELNSPFLKDTDITGWFYTTTRETKSWLQSGGSNKTVAYLNSTVLKVDEVAFSALIKMYLTSLNYDGCLRVYCDMKVYGVKPSMATYNNLLRVMGRGKRAREAKAIYEEMINNGISPNQSTYEAVLQAYCRGIYKVDALSVYKEMKEKGMGISRVLYNMLLHMCAEVGDADEAVKIFQEMKSSGTCHPDSVTYSSLINLYSRIGKVSEAEAMLNEMMNDGIEPNLLVMTSLVYCYGKANQTNDIVRIFGQLLDLGLRPDYRFSASLVHVMAQIPKQDHGKIIGCIEKANPKLGVVVRYLMEERDGDGIFLKEASELFNSIYYRGIKKSVCSCLIDLCVNLEVPDRARGLFNLGLTLELYTDMQEKSPTMWSLHVKSLSTGVVLTALHVWINDLSKALESGEEFPPVLGIYTRKNISSVVESYLKEHNAPFHALSNKNNEFFSTNELAKSWLQSRILDVPAIVIESPPRS